MPLRFSEYVPIPFTVDGTPPPDPGPADDPAGDLLAAAPLERSLASLGVPVLETLCRQAGEVELEIPAPNGTGDPPSAPIYRVRVGVAGLKRDGALRTAEGIRDALLSRHPGLSYPEPKDRGPSLSERFLRDRLGQWFGTRVDNRVDVGGDGGGGDWAYDFDGTSPDPQAFPLGDIDAYSYT